MPEVLNAMEMEAPSDVVDISAGEPVVNVITIINTSNINNNNNNSATNNNHHNSGEPETEIGAVELLQHQHQQQQQLQLQPASNFVAIPLLERRRRSRSHSRSHCRIAPLAPIICIQNGSHPEELVRLSRSRSCFLRIRRTFAKLFGKIMGSNNPSEADGYDYYDCE
ncbi:hypothetical protein M5D96_012393 [Drosophila gunungcola]|uniref:Uncharacterized protein n=1 Tax=Drosophila gunungcola TaxID=103775 RepID=A0A9Q0BJK4_9MUSC|nr:hypothetical protein M5D96_012393 [Drosophila gunungcola]